MKIYTAIICCMLLIGCSGSKSNKQFLSAEDEAVLELLDDIKKRPNDKALLELLPKVYERAMQSREAMKDYVLRDNPAGDRWVLWRRQLEASQSITDAVMRVPQASAAIEQPVQFAAEISDARQRAAEEYYDLGLDYMHYNNRPYAQKALDVFKKANREVPGFRDVNRLMQEAEAMSLLVVMVNPVDYYNQGWSFWGLNNDYLQWQLIRDLNNRSYRNVKFYSESEVRSRRLHPERVVDMRFIRLMINNPYTERNQYQRSAQVQVTTRPPTRPDSIAIPPKYTTVYATVFVTRRLITGDADLECRILDVPTGQNILYDHFPGRYRWVFESATFTGDPRALTAEDQRLLNNQFTQYPTRESIAEQLIRDSYNSLLNRIQQGVNFDTY